MNLAGHINIAFDRPGRVLLGSFVVIAAMSVFVISDIETRLAFLADDAFYYTLSAKNFVEHGIPSLDGVNAANGFHPVLFWFDSILAYFGCGDIYIINQAIGAGFLCISAYLLFRYCMRFLDRDMSLLAALAYLFCPHSIGSSLAGLESTVYACVLILFYGRLVAYIRMIEKNQDYSYRDILVLGCLGALAYLTRTEFIIHTLGIVLGFFVLFVTTSREQKSFSRSRLCRDMILFVFPIVCSVAAIAWLSLVTTGHWVQSSASQKSNFYQLLTYRSLHAFRMTGFLKGFGYYGLLCLVAAMAPLLFVGRDLFRRTGCIKVMISVYVSVFLFYILFIHTYQRHYMASFITLSFLILPIFVTEIKSGRRQTFVAAAVLSCLLASVLIKRGFAGGLSSIDLIYVLLCIVLYLVISGRVFVRKHFTVLLLSGIASSGWMISQKQMFRTRHVERFMLAQRLNERLPHDVVIGAGPAGIYAKFIERKVMNMDGAISWPVLEALRTKGRARFLEANKVDVLLECGRCEGFERVSQFIQVRRGKDGIKENVLQALRDLKS